MGPGFSCSDCLYVWYEGAGVTVGDIRKASLERQSARNAAAAPTVPPPAG
jgi:hypothetical protein